jgi:hypothetical protein
VAGLGETTKGFTVSMVKNAWMNIKGPTVPDRSFVFVSHLQHGGGDLLGVRRIEVVVAPFNHGEGGLLGRREQLDLFWLDLGAVRRIIGSLANVSQPPQSNLTWYVSPT